MRFFVELDGDLVSSMKCPVTEDEAQRLLDNIPGLKEVSEDDADQILQPTGRRWKLVDGQLHPVMDSHNKETKWGMLKMARDAAEFGTFVWDGSTFDADSRSQSRIQGAAQLASLAISAGLPFSKDWTLADNTIRTLNAADMISVGMALGSHVGAQHECGRVLRQQLDAANTPEQIDLVQW